MRLKFVTLLICFNSLIILGQSNVALNKPVTVDSERASTSSIDYVKEKAVDGNIEGNNTRWLSKRTAWPHWIEVDLQATYEISQIKFWTGWNGYNNPVTYLFQIWQNDTWLTVVDGSQNTLSIVDESFTPISTDKVRLYATGSTGNEYFKLYELEVYGVETTNTSTTGVWSSDDNNIFYKYGNVGIGTENTDERLTVKDNLKVEKGLIIGDIGTNQGEVVSIIYTPFDENREFPPTLEYKINDPQDTDQSRYSAFFDFYGTSFYYYDALGEKLFGGRSDAHESPRFSFPQSNTSVSIGTDNYDEEYSLSVAGKIHVQEVKVDLLGAIEPPDYVFYENYDLKSLDQVQNYIKKEGHLPNIPSANEMKENGINLKEMNLKLLEKIEELTLYTIAQEKALKEQKILNVQLEERLQKIEQHLSK